MYISYFLQNSTHQNNNVLYNNNNKQQQQQQQMISKNVKGILYDKRVRKVNRRRYCKIHTHTHTHTNTHTHTHTHYAMHEKSLCTQQQFQEPVATTNNGQAVHIEN